MGAPRLGEGWRRETSPVAGSTQLTHFRAGSGQTTRTGIKGRKAASFLRSAP